MLDFIYYWRLYRRHVVGWALFGNPVHVLYGLVLVSVVQADDPAGRASWLLGSTVAGVLLVGSVVWLNQFMNYEIPERPKNWAPDPYNVYAAVPSPPGAAEWRAEWPKTGGYFQWRKLYTCGCCCISGFAWIAPLSWDQDVPDHLDAVQDPDGNWYVVNWGFGTLPAVDHRGDRVIDHWHW